MKCKRGQFRRLGREEGGAIQTKKKNKQLDRHVECCRGLENSGNKKQGGQQTYVHGDTA